MRARNIKPGFFKNEDLGELPTETRLLFIGLWCMADREGRLEDRPKRIKGELFAYDNFDVDSMLNRLQSFKFIIRYEVDGIRYIQIDNFVKHQDPHYREKASEIPPLPGHQNKIIAKNVTKTQRTRILERDGYKCAECGRTKQLCIDHIKPVSKGGGSEDDNLQVLCLSCNTAKGNRLSSETDSNSSQHRPDVDLIKSPNVPLIPDSLIPDSLIPEVKDMSPGNPGNGSYSSDFENLWQAYTVNSKGSKKNAYREYQKVKTKLPDNIIEIIHRQVAEKRKAASLNLFYPEFKHLERWLRAAEWEREPFNFSQATSTKTPLPPDPPPTFKCLKCHDTGIRRCKPGEQGVNGNRRCECQDPNWKPGAPALKKEAINGP